MIRQIIIVFLLAVFAACSQKFNPEITVAELKEGVEYLASDSLKGRKPGEPGDSLAAAYIRQKFEKAGLELLFDNGFQKFGLVTAARLGQGNSLSVADAEFEAEQDFLPYSFSANTRVEAPAVFAGFGLEVDKDTLQWNDYEGVDANGKWVIALQGDPDIDNPQSPFVEFSTERAKALLASDKNAAGLILVAGVKFSEKDELSPLFFDKNSSRYAIPVIQVTRQTADKLLAGTGETIESLESKIFAENKALSRPVNTEIAASINVEQTETESQNVVALLPGNDPQLKNEYVVAGAHYDHLGMGGPGSGSRELNELAVHNGADDNASGVAALIQLAEKFAAAKTNRRSMLFVAFGAEEMGLVGSKEFVNQPPVETQNMVAMFNFDMVGRLDTTSNALSIGGTKTAVESEELLTRLNDGFDLALSPEGVGPSDHASFYLQNVPVFFISTGAHPDYHTPRDVAALINYEGMKKVAEYAGRVMEEVVNQPEKLAFQEAGPKFQRSRGGRYKLTFGIMPDFAGLEKRGLRIDAVTKGKPADLGGMKKGDIITAIDGKKVGGIHDYMSRLQSLESGDRVSVDIIRNDKESVLIIQL